MDGAPSRWYEQEVHGDEQVGRRRPFVAGAIVAFVCAGFAAIVALRGGDDVAPATPPAPVPSVHPPDGAAPAQGGLQVAEVRELIQRIERVDRADRFVASAAAALRDDPRGVKALVDDYQKPGLGLAARAAILGVLAAVSHAEAQAGLRAIFGLPATRSDPDFATLVQHLAGVSGPEPETMRLLDDLYREKSGAERAAVARVIGAAAGDFHRRGAAEDAARHARRLARDLAAAAGEERRALLGALGIAGSDAAMEAIIPYAADREPATRSAAARALRRFESPRVRETLLGLCRDGDPEVRRSAVRVLGGLGGIPREELSALPAEIRQEIETWLEEGGGGP